MDKPTSAQKRTFATGHGIICAGLPRSGTLSLATALDILGVGPVQHGMRDNGTREVFAWTHAAWCTFPFLRSRLSAHDGKLPKFLPAYDPLLPWTRADWDRLVGRYRCTTDLGSMFSEQLITAYPEAKVIVVERPVDRWARSYCRVLIDRVYCGVGGFIKCTLGPWADTTTSAAYYYVSMGWLGTFSKREAYKILPERHREHYQMVRRIVPAEQVLEFDFKDGWEPLCKFLGVPVPDVPFPYVNDEVEFLQMLHGLDFMILSRLAKKLGWVLLGVGAAAFLSRATTRRDIFRAIDCMLTRPSHPRPRFIQQSLSHRFSPQRLTHHTTRIMAATEPVAEPSAPSYNPRYVDIGINLADRVYRGKYRGHQKHPDDLEAVMDRAKQVGCTKLLVTGSDWHSIKGAADLAKEYPGAVYYTAGIHPCSSSIFGGGKSTAHDEEHTAPCDPDPSAPIPKGSVDLQKSASNITRLKQIFADAKASGAGHLIAFGEFGLDYDRLHFCNKTVQLHSFAEQLKVAAAMEPQLPLFLHSRAAAEDFARLMKDAFGPRLENLKRGGVVHSFTGSLEEMRELLELGLYVGINGCSFKTEENCAVVKELPLDRIMLETDGPWCEVRPSHAGWKYLVEELAEQPEPAAESAAAPDAAAEADGTQKRHKPQKQPNHNNKRKNQKKEPEVPSRFKATKNWTEGCMVKGRNEPCTIERIAKIVAGIQGISVEEVCEAAWRNTNKVFDLGESA
ncbi:hypothetical protein PWT90_05022 [Aphanocladium album]|nr:hypothetical protein PWT90_05022 [Aphanocladium album]